MDKSKYKPKKKKLFSLPLPPNLLYRLYLKVFQKVEVNFFTSTSLPPFLKAENGEKG